MNKNKMLKTILPLLIIALLAGLLFAGCGRKTEEEFSTEEKAAAGFLFSCCCNLRNLKIAAYHL